MTPEDIKACEQNEMDKDALEEAIQKKTAEYLKDPLMILNDMDFDSNKEWANVLKQGLVDGPDYDDYRVEDSLIDGMTEHARMLAEHDLGL